MNVRLRMYQVLLVKFRRHLCKGAFNYNNQQQVSAWGKSRQVKKESKTKLRKMHLFQKLRMVLSLLYKQGFCARLGPCSKSRFLQGLLESMKRNGGYTFFFKGRRGYSFTDFRSINAFTYKKPNASKKI